MKKIIIYITLIIIAISPLFRGLFFALETNVFLTIIALLAVAYFLVKIRKAEEIRINKLLFILGTLFIAAYTVSFISAVNARDNISALIQIIECFIVSIILYDFFYDNKQQFGRIVLLTTSISGFINAIIGIEAISGYFKSLEITINLDRLGGTFQYANTAAIYFVICLVFTLSLLRASNKVIVKIIFYVLGNAALLAMILTASRGGYLVGFPVLLVYILIQPAKNKLKAAGSLICIMIPGLIFVSKISAQRNSGDLIQLNKWLLLSFLAAVILGMLFEYIKTLFARVKAKVVWGLASLSAILIIITIIILNKGFSAILPERILERFIDLAKYGFNDFNVYIRLEMDKWALKLISGDWLLGRGGGAWESLYQSVQSVFFTARNTHNNYLQIFVESGILGFISYLATIALSLWYALYSLIKIKDTVSKVLLSGISCGFLALVLHSSFDFDLTFVSLSLLFWVLISGSAVFMCEEGEKTSVRLAISFKNNIFKYVMIVICSILLSLNGLYSASSYLAEKGYNRMAENDLRAAQTCYEEAGRLDVINPVYMFQLSKIYKYYADASTDPDESLEWRKIARLEAEKCVALNNFYPEYRDILLKIYFDSSMPLEALDSAERLVNLQPRNNVNYDLLSRAYFEASDYYIKNLDFSKGKELLILCSQIDGLPGVKPDDTIESYKKLALEELQKY